MVINTLFILYGDLFPVLNAFDWKYRTKEITPKQVSSTLPNGRGRRTAGWLGAFRTGAQVPQTPKSRGTGYTPMIPVLLLHKSRSPTKPSEYHPSSIHMEHRKSCYNLRRPSTTGQLIHDHNHILLPPTPGELHRIQVQELTITPQIHRFQLQPQCLCHHHHRRRPPSRNVFHPNIHIPEEQDENKNITPKALEESILCP